ncbi:hypothetical protein GQ43DRAFT_361647 [Delitschia confertaspora ATCC 74209]|uniref:rRNA-processing protein FYV7 n=1 Tax=Delitschia confertaspora ATCC 74209 TaxID=1513339 RepID=A0A9P4MZY2_9PLEO|nr:hypothetical protein GQ43DRAFT_361647 [Delitschia confertaspora ATCC 74209]
MAPKRAHEDDQTKSSKKFKKGFNIGPANLPDGLHKRKVQKIKQDLIHKAKIKKEYAKVKAREEPNTAHRSVYDLETNQNEVEDKPAESVPEPTLELHPDRVKMLETEPEPVRDYERPARQRKRPKPQTYKNEEEIARKRREEQEVRQKAREEAEKERQRKLAEREHFRKEMAKARKVGPDGRMKLGRQSNVLLERVKKMVGNA